MGAVILSHIQPSRVSHPRLQCLLLFLSLSNCTAQQKRGAPRSLHDLFHFPAQNARASSLQRPTCSTKKDRILFDTPHLSQVVGHINHSSLNCSQPWAAVNRKRRRKYPLLLSTLMLSLDCYCVSSQQGVRDLFLRAESKSRT